LLVIREPQGILLHIGNAFKFALRIRFRLAHDGVARNSKLHRRQAEPLASLAHVGDLRRHIFWRVTMHHIRIALLRD
jgi:hypothetical protein